MAGHIKIAAGFSAFIVIFTMIMVSGGSELLLDEEQQEEYNITEEDLRFTADFPTLEVLEVDIEDDVIDSSNVELHEFDESDPDYGVYDRGWRLEPGAEEGNVTLRLPSESVEATYTTTPGTLGFGCGITRVVSIEGSDDTRSACGTTTDSASNNPVTDWDSPEVRFEFSEEDSYLYEVETTSDVERNALQTFVGHVDAATSALTNWFLLLTGLPGVLLWVSLFMGIVGILILAEILLW